MENKEYKQSPGMDSDRHEAAITNLLSQLHGLEKQVREILNNKDNQRLALDIGIVVLANKYPALSRLLYGIKEVPDVGKKNSATASSESDLNNKRSTHRKTHPPKKKSRGL